MNYAELIVESEADLTELENKQKLVQFQKRLRFLRLLKSGEAKTQEKARTRVGWKLRQSQKIWKLYRTGGTRFVLQKTARWQTGKLTSKQRGQLSEQLAAAGGAASLAQVRNHIAATFGAQYTIGGVSGLCQRLRIKLKTARPVSVKKDEARALEYKKTSAS